MKTATADSGVLMARSLAFAFLGGIASALWSLAPCCAAPAPRSDPALAARIRTRALTAEVQAGLLRRLTHNLTGQVLIDNPAGALPIAELPGTSTGDPWQAETTKRRRNGVAYRLANGRGDELGISWRADKATGDIILDVRWQGAEPAAEMAFPLSGIDIGSFAAILPNRFGECQVVRGPTTGSFGAGYSSQMAMSLMLFEGQQGCWAIAMHDADDSPKGFELDAAGNAAALNIRPGFVNVGRERRLFPIRFQACKGSWRRLADRFALEWLEQGLGMTPLSERPEWIQDIRVSVGVDHKLELEHLTTLAEQLIPEQTLLYVTYWRSHSFDYGYPDYTPTDAFKIWCARARALGFHVAAHFNMHGVNKAMDEHFERFRPGMNPDYPGWGVRDPDTGLQMWSLDGGRSGHYYVSSSYRPWREFYVEAVKAAVDCGVDVIHLDESHTAMTCPAANRDIPNIFKGNVALQKTLRGAYPNVALQGEQFNDMNMRHACFAQVTPHAEHTVAHHVFSRFVKFVKRPGGGDLDSERAGYENLGFKLPWGNVPLKEGVVEEMRAFQDYHLDPAPDLALGPDQRFGYRGAKGVTAFLERGDHTSGLAVYRPDGTRRSFNVRHFGITEHADGILPGWLIYGDDKLYGLDPERSYGFTPGVMPQDEFHLASIPPGFELKRGVTGHERAYYIVESAGHGTVEVVVPAALTEIYANGRRLAPVGGVVGIEAEGDVSLIAFAGGPELPPGLLNQMPWAIDGLPPGERSSGFTARGSGFFHHAGTRANIIGRLPSVQQLRLRGALAMDPAAKNGMTGIVTINGREVARVENVERPWSPKHFEVDISEFAGQDVMIQFATIGSGGYNFGGWEGFEITVE